MNAARWQTTKSLLLAVLEQDRGARAGFLDAATAGDLELRSEVRALLAAYDAAGDRFEEPPALAEEDGFPAPPPLRLGSYRVLRELGSGGMGVVYLAESEDPELRRQVAIKVIRHGMDSQAIVRRFHSERQILASLSHPNIARLYEGGTTADGLPYFVMEYVAGEPFDSWCVRLGLSTAARLELFRRICAAVQYAHQNLIVHRDLKPSNILVDDAGDPKLLDFGIAKLLDPKALSAQDWTALDRPMTPEYASPEQVRGGPITTASDVYSLGVLLYRLVTGSLPYRIDREAGIGEAIRVVSEHEPPSTVVPRADARGGAALPRRLASDLDAIVAKAMRKDPSRRYPSADQLGEDLRRLLAGLPVQARRDSVGYRARKAIGRHRAGFATAAVLLLALLGTTAIAVTQARIAERERARAEQRLEEVRQLAQSFLFEFHDAIKNLPGATPARRLVVSKALEYLDRLHDEAGASRALRRDLATAYQRVGDVQGLPDSPNLGDGEGAERSYRRGLAILTALHAAGPDDVEIEGDLGRLHTRLGKLLAVRGDRPGARSHLDAALRIAERQAELSPVGGPRRDLMIANVLLGDLIQETADLDAARRHFEAAIAIAFEERSRTPEAPESRRDYQVASQRLASVLAAQGDLRGALALGRDQLVYDDAAAAADPDNAEAQSDLATTLNALSKWQRESGDALAAVASARRALVLCEALLVADPDNTMALSDVSSSLWWLGEAQAAAGDPTAAIASLRRALAIERQLVAADPGNTDLLDTIAETAGRITALEEVRRPE